MVFSIKNRPFGAIHRRVEQLVAHWSHTPGVEGSSPSPANFAPDQGSYALESLSQKLTSPSSERKPRQFLCCVNCRTGYSPILVTVLDGDGYTTVDAWQRWPVNRSIMVYANRNVLTSTAIKYRFESCRLHRQLGKTGILSGLYTIFRTTSGL